MKKIVFAGPSTHQADLASFSDIEFRPPAASGDILAAVNDGAQVIGLIDGFFGNCAAVWHKELLFALSQGLLIFGAASMGALRAAECDAYGMRGVGRIYQEYRDGLRVSDADVAVVHAPAELGFRPMTIALVDAQETIRSLHHRLGDEQVDRLLAAARQLHFSRRTWRSIVEAAQLERDTIDLLSRNALSIKRCDAACLIAAVQDAECPLTPVPNWRFQETLFFQALISSTERFGNSAMEDAR